MCSSLNEGLAVGSLGEFVEYSVFLVLISRPVSWQNVQTAFHSWSRWSLLLAIIVRSSQKATAGVLMSLVCAPGSVSSRSSSGLMASRKSSGERGSPCGTPRPSGIVSEMPCSSFIWMERFLYVALTAFASAGGIP